TIMGDIVAALVVEYANDDGWNSLGNIGKDGTPCTANCRPYHDTTGYAPNNYPSGKGHKKSWRSLQEDNGKGFFQRQEHVTPHIGRTGKPRVISQQDLKKTKIKKGPKYKYNKESELVLERLRNLTDQQKMQVEFFDDKIAVALLVAQTYLGTFGPAVSWERFVQFLVGYTSGEYDTVLLAWKEKVRYDLVRPTTWIQEWGDELVETWAGPGQGVQTFKARDFQPYIRVMPHSEFVSGSGCICQNTQEFTDAFLEWAHGHTGSLQTQLNFPSGSSKTEPGLTPASPVQVNFNDLTELKETCGQSRLDGGMHFTASVPASYELCEGVGTKALEFVQALTNGNTI
ncbi:MAG: hypothetical protein ACTSUE_09065, partial [Promethearchaeota archaeon]